MVRSVALFLLVLSHSIYGQTIISSSDYGFPEANYLESTISTSSIGIPGGAQWIKIKLNPKNRKINGKMAQIKIHYYKPSDNYSCGKQVNTRLTFLLTGLGGEANGGQANHYAKVVADNCMHVAILPSIFTKNFVKAVSSRGIVGNFRNDADDFYDFMIYTRDFLESTQNIKFQSYSVFGYSLGGLTTAFISEIDSKRKIFNFNSALIINTPVDLLYGMRVLEGYADQGKRIGRLRMSKILFYWGKNILTYRRVKTDVRSSTAFVDNMYWLREHEKQFVVGKALMANLGEVILTTQDTLVSLRGYDSGILTPKDQNISSSDEERRVDRKRKKEAGKFGFVDYMNKFVIKFLNRRNGETVLTAEKLNFQNSLMALEEHIRSNKNLHIMHNADDFLLRKGDAKYLAEIFGERLTLYPRGGHVGNLWFSENSLKMIEILKSN